jgi:starch synthase
VGDVVRDLPLALAGAGWRATVLTPSYGRFHLLPGARRLGKLGVQFRGARHQVRVFEIGSDASRTVLFDYPLLAPTEPGRVYDDDPADRPYATDADKFAFFCTAAAAWIDALPEAPDAVHLHDWHAAYYLLHREFTIAGPHLKSIPTVFTIHNLAYQGQRPFDGDESSLVAWHPGMEYDPELLRDPVTVDCLNPMAFAIRCADRVNTVSPTYAQEIQCPSNPANGFYGGEGLEDELVSAAEEGRLAGILNGCDYSVPLGRRPGWQRLVLAARETLEHWCGSGKDRTMHELALERLASLPKRRPLHVLTSIGRIVSQKMMLFMQPLEDGRSALEHILDNLGRKGVLLLLGSGNADYEKEIFDLARSHDNLVFLRGYAEDFGNLLYHGGDLFLMPSSFEPCGISQMLAMRAGQPCVVHGVGGLHDTVESGVTGFVFSGNTPTEQASAFVAIVTRAMEFRHDHPNRWQAMRKAAASRRFDWATSARHYVEQMYEPHRR